MDEIEHNMLNKLLRELRGSRQAKRMALQNVGWASCAAFDSRKFCLLGQQGPGALGGPLLKYVLQACLSLTCLQCIATPGLPLTFAPAEQMPSSAQATNAACANLPQPRLSGAKRLPFVDRSCSRLL